MKVTFAILATLAVGALAAPAPDPAAEPWCIRHGEPCGRKREAAPEPLPEPQPEPEAEAEPWCIRHGEPCGKKKREAAPEPEPQPEPQPEAEAEPWCVRHGEPCGKKKREAAPDPEPQPEPEAEAEAEAEPWCVRHGEPCGKKKREPEPEPEPWCTRHGEPCGKKRDVFEASFSTAKRESPEGKVKRAAYALAQTLESSHLQAREPSPEVEWSNLPGGAVFVAKRGVNELASAISLASRDPAGVYQEYNMKRSFGADTDVAKREALPSPFANHPDSHAAEKRWCASEGHTCFQAKRAAEAVLEIVGDVHSHLARAPFDPEWAVKRDPEPWCIRHGEPCGKKRSAEPEADPEADPWCARITARQLLAQCNKNKRDLASIQLAARSLLASLE